MELNVAVRRNHFRSSKPFTIPMDLDNVAYAGLYLKQNVDGHASNFFAV